MNDPSFLQLLRVGDSAAFRQLAATYKHLVFNTVLSIVQRVQEAEDLSQEVFIQVYQSIAEFRGEAKLSTWIYRIAVSKALDWERKQKSAKGRRLLRNLIGIGRKEEETIPDFHHPGIELHRRDSAAALFRALNQLPEKQRVAFILLKVEGLSYQETAEVLKTSVKGVEGLAHRAKANLRTILKDYFTE